MSEQTLNSPVLGGTLIRSVNFFNGRLLTGDDLRAEQAALRARLQRLGRLSAEGVAAGLEVRETAGTSTAQHPVVTISAGLALAPSGLVLELAAATDVLLARSAPTATSESGGLFADCQPFAPGTYTAGAGVYLLTIGPASQSEGLAPVNGLGNQSAPCNTATSVETVQFRLIRLALSLAELDDRPHLRNLVAYQCFAPDALAAFAVDPFAGAPASYGLIDRLRAGTLSADEVPLGLIGWSNDDGIGFVDLWSVRRRLTRRAAEGHFAALAGDRRRAEGEAMFLQFQAHVDDLRFTAAAATLGASGTFARLPAAGLLPLRTSAFGAGFELAAFFAGMTTRGPEFINAARLAELLHVAAQFPPIDVAGPELVWLYLVRENSSSGAQPYALFAGGQLPYAADARLNASYFDYANYGLV